MELYVYNPHGDLVEKRTFTNGTDTIIERYGYDMLGRRVSAVNALGVETVTAYDANGNVIAESGATYPVRYAYDSQNRRVAMWTNRSGDEWDETRWAYDPATGLCTSKTYADGSVTTYAYTSDGLLETTRYASGHWVRNLYDQSRQIVGTQYDSAPNVSLTLDVFGRELAAVNATAAYSYSRDPDGLATNEVVAITGVSHELSRLSDNDGRLIAFDAGEGYAAQTIAYRSDGRIGAISTADAVVSYTYGEGGFETGYSLSVDGGATFTRTVLRDPFRRGMILDVQNSIGQGYGYAYDALSRPVTRNADVFAYNFRSEVIGANVAGQDESYDYDNIGNSTFAAFNSVTNLYAANGLNQYVSIASDGVVVDPAYDEGGNMVAYGPWSYAYDSVGRLTTVSSNGLVVATNSYDHQGRRVRLVTQAAAHTFIYDGWNVVLECVEHDGVTDRIEYYWGRDLSGTLQGAGGVGGLLYLKRNGSIYVPIYDAYGNVMEYRAADGSLAASYVYDAFGRTISQTGLLADAFRFRFSTKYFDSETGLFYYGYRFYSPMLTRWLNRDPIEEDGGLNLYGFCGNNPMCFVDLIGLSEAPINPYFRDTSSGFPILDYLDVVATERQSYRATDYYYKVNFIARFTSPLYDSEDPYSGCGRNALGGFDRMYRLKPGNGDVPKSAWGKGTRVRQKYSACGVLLEDTYHFPDRKVDFGYFVYRAKDEKSPFELIDSNPEMYSTWSRGFSRLPESDKCCSGFRSPCEIIEIQYGDRGCGMPVRVQFKGKLGGGK